MSYCNASVIVTAQIKNSSLSGSCTIPTDKSLTHRSIIVSSIAQGKSRIKNALSANDCLYTKNIMSQLGIQIQNTSHNEMIIRAKGLYGLTLSSAPLLCGNSGTTMRLLAGLLSAQQFSSTLSALPQLQKRPMQRVVQPLQAMGALIESSHGLAPLFINPTTSLQGIVHHQNVPSAQVKSALVLAALYAKEKTTIIENIHTRDHTERMLLSMGAKIHCVQSSTNTIDISPVDDDLHPIDISIPGDISSAAFLIVAASILHKSKLTIPNVGINDSRTGIIDALRTMGASITFSNQQTMHNEPIADILIQSSSLKGCSFMGTHIVRMIDELPILAVAATQAEGITTISNAQELRVKETDRITTVVSELRKLGAKIEEHADGFSIEGPTPLQGTLVDSHGDHRLAMALCIAGLCAQGVTTVCNTDVIDDSFPGFIPMLRELGAAIERKN